MDRQILMEYIAERFGIEADEDGKYNICGYDWQSGCYIGHEWFCLAEVVYLFEDICNDIRDGYVDLEEE